MGDAQQDSIELTSHRTEGWALGPPTLRVHDPVTLGPRTERAALPVPHFGPSAKQRALQAQVPQASQQSCRQGRSVSGHQSDTGRLHPQGALLEMSHGQPHQTYCTGEKMAFLERLILLRIMSCRWALDVWGFLRVWQLQGPVQTPASDGGAWENTFQSFPGHLSEPLSGASWVPLWPPPTLDLFTSSQIWGH